MLTRSSSSAGALRMPAFLLRASWLFAFCFVTSGLVTAQITFTPELVSPKTDRPLSVSGADIDGDGDQDVFAAAWDQGFAWHENIAGDGSIWIEHMISPDMAKFFVVASDIDGDGDADAVTGGLSPDPTIWYENVAGDGTTWTRHVISAAPITVRAVQVADVDGDGDTDVLAASESSGEVLWYENRFGDGSAWLRREIGVIGAALSVVGADIDGDGDIDAAVADSNRDLIRWYRNVDGKGVIWASRVISLHADGAHSVAVADVDADGDLDVLSASFHEDRVAWHENLGGSGGAWEDHQINTNGGRFISVVATDMDNDGDIDAVSSAFDINPDLSSTNEQVTWYENRDGQGLEWRDWSIKTDTGKARQAIVLDVDGDCDVDVVSATSTDDTVFWHENDLNTVPMCPGEWTDLGGGTSGAGGVPLLVGTGPKPPATLVTLKLTSAAPFSQVLLYVSIASAPLPIFDGTLHAFPYAFQVGLQTGPAGTTFVPGAWPTGVPPGVEFWFQELILDEASPYGVTLSNGVKLFVP